MRIAVVSDMVRPNGAGVMALLAADILTEAGHDVRLLSGAMDAQLERELSSAHDGAFGFTHDERALDGSITESDHVAFLLAFRRWFDAHLTSWEPDVIYVHNCGRVLSQLDLADLSRKVPVVHTMHDEWFITDAHYTFRSATEAPVVRTFEPGRSEAVLEHRYDHIFNVPERIGAFTAVAPSAWLADRARRVFPTLDVVQLENAVDTEAFDLQDRGAARALLGLPADRAIVLFVGSPTQERKGFQAFERAMRAVNLDAGTPVRLVAGGSASMVSDSFAGEIGPGPIADNLGRPPRNPLGAIGVLGDALVLSGLDRSLMPALIGAADVLVHPSAIDNLPTVPIEAGLCGTRCLASDVGGTRETIADLADLFPLDISAGDLAARIATAIDEAKDETVAERRARRGIQLERFGIDRHRDRLLAVLDTARSKAHS